MNSAKLRGKRGTHPFMPNNKPHALPPHIISCLRYHHAGGVPAQQLTICKARPVTVLKDRQAITMWLFATGQSLFPFPDGSEGPLQQYKAH